MSANAVFPPLARPTDRVRFEELLASLAAPLVDAPTDQLDTHLRTAVQALVGFFGFERGCLAEFTPAGTLTPTYAFGVPEFPSFPPTLLEERHLWHLELLRQGRMLLLNALPSEEPAAVVPGVASQSPPRDVSHLFLPLCVGGAAVGVVVFGSYRRSRPWPEGLLPCTRRLSEVLGQALVRQQLERQVQRLRDQMAHVSRVTLLGELAGAIAHEVNQPLCAIVSNAQAAQRFLSGDAPDFNEVREALVDIAADSQRASDVLNRIRLLLQKRTLQAGPVDLNQAVREAVALTQPVLARQQIAVTLDLAAALPLVWGDRVQLQQVVLNLLLNAIDAMTQEGTDTRLLVLHSFANAQGAVEIVVRDSGPGIAPELRERIFDPFYTTKANGMGIGLSLCRTILQASGGRIWAAPGHGGGAALHVTLPPYAGASS